MNEIGRKRRQALVMILCPAVLERHVPSFDVTGFYEALPDCGHTKSIGLRQPGAQKTDHR